MFSEHFITTFICYTNLSFFVDSFLSSTGEGFEAFFTEKGYIVIAVCTKKEYFATCVTDLPFDDQEWVCRQISSYYGRN